jgi:hypothetical protein
MLTKGAKKLMLHSLGLSKENRLIGALLHDITHTASKQDISLLEELFSSVDLLQTFLEDRIRKLKLSGRTVPDPPGLRARPGHYSEINSPALLI